MHNTELLNEKFNSLPTPGIIELAKRIPTHRIADDRIFNFLRKQSHKLPDQIIIDGLKRDDRFIWLCLKHKLDDQILPWLITRLHKRHPLGNSTKIIIELVCKKATLTPELKADLHWHFVHTDSYTQQQAIAGMLEKLPGFDFISAINDAWILAKLNENHPYSIAPFAVQLGDKEALRHTLVAIKHSNQPNSPKHTKQDLVERLQPSLQTKLPADQAANWAAKHYTRLIFNPDTRKFHLP